MVYPSNFTIETNKSTSLETKSVSMTAVVNFSVCIDVNRVLMTSFVPKIKKIHPIQCIKYFTICDWNTSVNNIFWKLKKKWKYAYNEHFCLRENCNLFYYLKYLIIAYMNLFSIQIYVINFNFPWKKRNYSPESFYWNVVFVYFLSMFLGYTCCFLQLMSRRWFQIYKRYVNCT